MSYQGINMKREKTTEKKPKGKLFTSEYQPSPEAKSLGWKRAKAKNIVLETILKEVTENMVDIKIKGETLSVPTLVALIKKMIVTANKDDKALVRVINMLLEYESRQAVVEQRQEEFDRRHGDESDEAFNDSFIQALEGKVEDIWQ